MIDSPLRHRVNTIARAVVGRKTGLFGALHALPTRASEFPITHVVAAMPNYEILPGGGKILSTGGSSSETSHAVTCALFESIERYCAAFVDRHTLVHARPSGDAFLRGDRLPLFAPHQYAQAKWPFRPLSDEAPIWWAEARSLATARRAFVPAILVYIPYRAQGPEECLGPCTSTGMACALTWAEACLTGLLEVSERDAFMIMWNNRLSMPRLRVERGSAMEAHVAHMLAGSEAKVTFVNVTTDFALPAVVAVVESAHGGAPLVALGSACKPTFEAAARKALAEALKESVRLRFVMADARERWVPAPDFSNVTDFEWHSLVYVDPKMQRELAFITASEVEQPMEQSIELRGAPDEMLAEAVARVARAGEDPHVVGLTTRDVEDLGVHVVKVMVPGAVPMSPDHRYPWLGSARLTEVPCRLGYTKTPTRLCDLNLAVPHPFA